MLSALVLLETLALCGVAAAAAGAAAAEVEDRDGAELCEVAINDLDRLRRANTVVEARDLVDAACAHHRMCQSAGARSGAGVDA